MQSFGTYNIQINRLESIGSTNDFLRSLPTPGQESMTVAATAYQTAGRGQGSNTWESERGKNLLFSILTSPQTVDVSAQFVLSMAGALALKSTLDAYIADVTLKWPNDIYWRDRKISGTLIETSVKGKTIQRCIYGIGLNINQREFRGDAPNPVSLYNIIGRETPLDEVLYSVLRNFCHYYGMAVGGDTDALVCEYNASLYRRDGMHRYQDTATGNVFDACIEHVGTDGLLRLIDSGGQSRAYSLKEVKFIV